MDVLSDVLRAIRLNGAIFFDVELHSPWVTETPNAAAIAGSVMPEAQHVISFHSVLEGACWAQLVDGSKPALRLNAGDIVVFPIDDQHALSSSAGMRAPPDLAMYYRPADRALPFVIAQGGGAESCHFVCGYLGCDVRPFNPLLSALPRMFHSTESSGGGQDWLTNLVRQGVKESESGRAGGETILAKIAELMFVEVLRQHIDGLAEGSPGWLSGLRDRDVGKALRLIHGRPAAPWTLEALAREVGLSRSVFSERFAHYVAVSPMNYLARWRLQLAARLLERPGVSVAQAGSEVGYESEAAFNRAFKKYVGTPPGAWRKGRLRSSPAEAVPMA
jgi:AraC-like DNA-binding protein